MKSSIISKLTQHTLLVGILLLSLCFVLLACGQHEDDQLYDISREESEKIDGNNTLTPTQRNRDSAKAKPIVPSIQQAAVLSDARIKFERDRLIVRLQVANNTGRDIVIIPTISGASRRKDAILKAPALSMGMLVHYWCDGDPDPEFTILEPFPRNYNSSMYIQFISIPNGELRELIYTYDTNDRNDSNGMLISDSQCIIRAEIDGFPYWYSTDLTVKNLLPYTLVKDSKYHRIIWDSDELPYGYKYRYRVEGITEVRHLSEADYHKLRFSQNWVIPRVVD